MISRSKARRRLAAGLALLVVAGLATAVVVTTGSPPAKNPASDTGSPTGAATVRRRNLVQTDTESGTLSYKDPQTVYNRLGGTITWLPRVGDVIKPGGTLFKVDGQPVVLMSGATPAFRDLGASDDDGPDIAQLNRNLVALGFNSDAIVVDDVWQPATTVGVELLQESLGETETGALPLGDVVFLPGDQLVSALDTTVGSTGGSGGGSSAGAGPAASTAAPVTAAVPGFVSLRRRATPTSQTDSPSAPSSDFDGKTLKALTALLRAEAAELKAQAAQLKADRNSAGDSTRHSTAHPNSSSDTAGATPILQTTSTRLVVTVDLAASSQSEANVGEPVTVEMPAGVTVNGTVTAVSPVAQSSSSSDNGASASAGGQASGTGGSSSTVPVTVTLRGHHTGAGLDQAAVSVNFARARARHVLSVPVTALLATPGDNYAVQEAAAPYRLIPVTTGLFAAGYVQISGPGVYAGLQVTDSQG